MGIRSIAVFSDADATAPHVKLADTAIHIGGSEVKSSYLNVDALIEAAKISGAEAVHPGYGFLSENEDFARRLEAENLIFIGPNPNAIEWMGSKSKAKEIASQHNVPLVPGYRGDNQELQTFVNAAKEVGYPVLLKAAAGGGGKGMRIIHEEKEMEDGFHAAKREAMNAFGDDELLLEKYFPSSRHIEIQIFGDKHGNAVYLLERECSIQRRYQKIFEESPSPVLDETTRKEMGEAAVRLAKALKYDNAGTVEFIWSEGKFYFLEVNTRLQVEHPVTEAITGLDLVKLQIEVASGLPLSIKQEDVKANGYALECRLYAEDTVNHFLPTTGKLLAWETPELEGLRYDSGIETGSEISIYYDPMISKIIAHGSNRTEAIRKMEYALRHLVCLGTTTNHSFLLSTIQHPAFIKGDYDTHFIANHLKPAESEQYTPQQINLSLIAATLTKWSDEQQKKTLLKEVPSGWRNNFFAPQKYTFDYKGEKLTITYRAADGIFSFQTSGDSYEVKLLAYNNCKLSALIQKQVQNFNIAHNDSDYYVQHEQFPQIKLTLQSKLPAKEKEVVKGGYVSPMPASVIKVLVNAGDNVKNGQSLLVLSSMKMENTITCSDDGIVEEIYVAAGENIEAGKLLLKIKTQ
jgi:3-methylcrotonyl-CoA carboxylase alpha subunit